MTFEEYASGPVMDYALGGVMSGLIAIGIVVSFVAIIALYVYFAYSWMTIARKSKYKYPWLAWIPVANLAMILQMGGFHWAWIFLIVVPFIGWIAILVLSIIAHWRIFEARNYPGWFSLSLIIPKVGGILYLIAIGFVAYRDNGVKSKPVKKVAKKKSKK